MDRDEVLALSDEDLRLKAAQLNVPLDWADVVETAKADLPDYPNDITAAMELEAEARSWDYWMSCEYKLMSTIPAESGWEVCLRGVGIANCAEAAMAERYFVEAETLSCAITRAFVLAMTLTPSGGMPRVVEG